MSSNVRKGKDAWFSQYEETKLLTADTLAIIQERNVKYPTGGQDASRLTAVARKRLGTLGSAIESLQELLESADCGSVSEVEKNVRRDMITTLKNSREQMQQALRRSTSHQHRTALLVPSAQSSSSPGLETTHTAELSNHGILQLQRNTISEQDTELAEMEKTVTSTKHIALTINEELGLQERLLEDLSEDVDVSHSRLRAAQKKLNTVMRQSGSCKMTIITILLMFVLMVVIILCFKLAKLLFFV